MVIDARRKLTHVSATPATMEENVKLWSLADSGRASYVCGGIVIF
jgi:hypothetical protein